LPDDPFANPIWNALHTSHRHFAMTAGRACKYPAEVSPFAAVAENTTAAFGELHSLMEPGETTYVACAELPVSAAGLEYAGVVPCLQMAYPEDAPLPEVPNPAGVHIVPLTCADAADMVGLTNVAFPGFFRRRTCEMGDYFGIRDEGRLIAMCGERMVLSPFREMSGLCTHPDHRGKGFGALLLVAVLRHQRAQGAVSVLHVASGNRNAIALYHRLGFKDLREILIHRLARVD
jgi:ribosomal protein S18 acetylase RimI-like enzyme